MTLYAGIDPGLSGALSVILPTGEVRFYDTPTIEVTSGKRKRRQFLVAQMVHLLTPYATGEVQVALEQVASRPGQSSVATFSFGQGYGCWIGILAAMGIPVTFVIPQTWKKAMAVTGDKGAAIVRATQLFPATAKDLTLVKHHGRADSLLIAAWLRQKNGGG